MTVPIPTPALRVVHIDCLDTLVRRGMVHAPSCCPHDGLPYPSIHDTTVQVKRAARSVPCGPRGNVDDYVSFYFGPRGPMLLRLCTGTVEGYSGGQEPLIYLVVHAQAVDANGLQFAFSDGHGLATFTSWFDDLAELDKVDWDVVYTKYWSNSLEYPDRQRRKQAEFLVHLQLPWELVAGIAVCSARTKSAVEVILNELAPSHRPSVVVRRQWFYN